MFLDGFTRDKKKRPINSSAERELVNFSKPITVFLNHVKSIDTTKTTEPPQAMIELTPHTVTCLKDAIALNRLIVRNVKRRLNPVVGDIVCVIDEDPTDVYRQILFELVKRGEV